MHTEDMSMDNFDSEKFIIINDQNTDLKIIDSNTKLIIFDLKKNTDNNLEPIQKNNTATNSTANTPIEQTRWNGWGNVSINKTVSPHGAKLIKSHIGKTKKLSSVSLQQVLKTVPKSRLPAALTDLNIVSTDKEVRL